MSTVTLKSLLAIVILVCLLIKVRYSNAKPNVLIIVADDLGWDDVSYHGSTQIRTPNIDALASDGITLSNYYVSPICSPSRSALLTGMHPIHTGMQHSVIAAAQPWGLPLKFKIMPQYFKELGYETHLVGKWHQGYFKREYLPTKRGFDTHFGYWNGKEDHFEHTEIAKYWGADLWRNETAVHNEYVGQYSTSIYKEEVKSIIKKYHNSSDAFFLLFASQAVHAGNDYSVLQAPKLYVDRFPHIKDHRRRIFAGMLSAFDDAVGEIFEELSKSEAINNTIIIFTTDNGAATGGSEFKVDNSVGSNWPLRGVKYTLWEGGIKGVAFVWSRLLNKSRYEYSKLMHIQDWLPTLYSAAGGDRSKLPTNLDGIDFWDILSHKKSVEPRVELLHNIDDIWGVYALRYKDYKLISGTVFGGILDSWFEPPGLQEESDENKVLDEQCLVQKILKFRGNDEKRTKKRIDCGEKPLNASTNCNPRNRPCLYNIKLDPCEFNNIADVEKDITEYLLSRIRFHNKTAVAVNNKPNDPKSNPIYHNYHWDVWQ